jgi:hypothetical protein
LPRSNLPATEGALLFEGERVGNSFIGTAYVFSTKCGPRGYAVRGFVTNNDQKIVMRGKAPLADANCVVARTGMAKALPRDVACEMPISGCHSSLEYGPHKGKQSYLPIRQQDRQHDC